MQSAGKVGALAALLSCREATQLDVVLSGRGFECEPVLEEHERYSETALRASSQVAGLFESQDEGRWAVCTGGDPEDGLVDLGNVVLVPAGGRDGPVEVLVIVALEGGDTSACLANYQQVLEGGDDAPEALRTCIVARRSLGFIPYASLRVPITLDSRCAGTFCDGSRTCVEGECVSATVECAADDCELVEVGGAGGAGAGGAGAGGAGAGGAGAGAGAGGAGGAGGMNVVWEPLDVEGAAVRDVVAFPADGDLVVVAATDLGVRKCIATTCDWLVDGDFAAIALRGGTGPATVAWGASGAAFDPADNGPTPASGATHFAVDWAADGPPRFTTNAPHCGAPYFAPGLTDNTCHIAVASRALSRQLSAYEGSLRLDDPGTYSVGVPVAVGPWSLWVAPADHPTLLGYAAAPIAGNSSRVYELHPPDPNSVATEIDTIPDVRLVDVGALDDELSVVYALGEAAGAPWFHRIDPDGIAPWEPLVPPPFVPSSMWLTDVDATPYVVVGGAEGLVRAELGDVVP